MQMMPKDTVSLFALRFLMLNHFICFAIRRKNKLWNNVILSERN